MFGRSGQMFPRRAYHDAMYEEEYGGGSDSDEDCCRGRGVTGVLCWFFSVIILIGLAASVILTVFFVLKSRNLMGSSNGGGGVFDDLDLLYGFNHRNKFDKNDTSAVVVEMSTRHPTTTIMKVTTMSDSYPDSDFTSSSKESQSGEKGWGERSSSSPVTVTAIPTRRSYGVMNRMTTTTVTTTTTTTWVTPTTSRPTKVPTTTPVNENGGLETPNSTTPRRISAFGLPGRPLPNQLKKDVGSNERWTPILPGPPHASSSSEETLSTTSHAHVLFSMPPSTMSNNVHNNRRRPIRGPLPTSFSTATEREDEKASIPPSEGQGDKDDKPPATNSTSIKGSRGDILERIIKNLGPKFKNRTEIFSSQERPPPVHPNLRIKTTIRTRTTSPASPPADELEPSVPIRVTALEVVEPPKFGTSKVDNSSTEAGLSSQEFMDILVGDEDQKRLVTKTTGSGIIRSVILPSWFVNDTEAQNTTVDGNPAGGQSGQESGEPQQQLNSGAIPVDNNDAMTTSGSSHINVHTQVPSGIGLGQIFMNMFNPDPPSGPLQEPNRVGTFSHLPRQPITTILEEPKRPLTSFRDLLKELAPVFPPSTFRPENGPGRVHFHDDEEGGHVTSEEENQSDMEGEEPAPSHIIEVAYDGSQRPQIIIEPEGHAQEEDGETTRVHHHHHHREPLNSASEIHAQLLPPPQNFKIPIPHNANMTTTTAMPDGDPPNIPMTLTETNVGQELENVGPILNPDDKLESDELGSKNETGQDETWLESSPEISGEIQLPEDYNRLQVDRVEEIPNEVQESTDFHLQRHPVSELDENLFSQGPSSSFQIVPPPVTKPEPERKAPKRIPGILKEQPIVHQVYSMTYSTPSPTKMQEPMRTIVGKQEPMRTVVEKQEPIGIQYQDSNPPANSTGFHPPELIDFHSTVHSFKPSVVTTSSGFTPLGGDTWRPVVYSEGEENQFGHNAPAQSHRYPQPMGFGAGNGGGGSILPTFKLRPTSTGSQFDQSVEANVHWSNGFTNPKTSTKPSTINPSQPIPPPPLMQQQPSRVIFPSVEQEMVAQQAAAVVVDRTKYLHRPAPPPILMRRTPQQMHRPGGHKNLRNPPYLNQQQQIQQQRMLKERLYHQHMTRMGLRRDSGGGNVQWPQEGQPIRRNG